MMQESVMERRAWEIASLVAASERYRDGLSDDEFDAFLQEIGSRVFAELVYIPYVSREKISAQIDASEEYSSLSVDEVLEISWAAALRERAIRFYDEKVHFPLLVKDKIEGAPIEITLKQSDPELSGGLPYYLQWVSFVRMGEADSHPGKALESFAFIPWDKLLSMLADAALPEPWDFGKPDDRGHRYEILKSYINYTFYRLELQGKVCITDDGAFAAFNSGLVDSWYQDIYVCFEPQSGEVEWRFSGLATKGNRGLRKRVAECFNPLPQRAKWFESLQDVLYDPERELRIDDEHILLDNIRRFPLKWTLAALDPVKVAQLPSRDEGFDDDQFFGALSDMIANDYAVYDTLNAKISSAVKLARRRVSWNYKAAIPSYYPMEDSMSFLLPLCLIDPEKADAALVVELQPSGAYQGVTVLDMEMAYKDARLICRPDSDWLNAALI